MSGSVREREATHAGSWYTDDVEELERQLDRWLGQAELLHGPARAIIAPHAGYRYSGAVSACAFRQVSPVLVKRVFILGPSHHVRLSGCALSSHKHYATPAFPLPVDQQVYAELQASGEFEVMTAAADEEEHSLEMQLPYIARIMTPYREQVSIVPILVGSLSVEREAVYGRLLAHYLADPHVLFVISSDFCHWGHRFRYTPHFDRSSFNGPIWQCIQQLDQQGMELIEALSPVAFTEYLKRTGNTICGRHPISVLLQAVVCLQQEGQDGAGGGGKEIKMKFVQYAQSNRCTHTSDSSVSYAAAALTIH